MCDAAKPAKCSSHGSDVWVFNHKSHLHVSFRPNALEYLTCMYPKSESV